MNEPAFLPFHALVAAPSASPSRIALVLHGMLGSGGNFRSFVKELAAACPDYAFALVDLRAHGQSQGAPPPHTIDAAAEDLVRLDKTLTLPVRGVIGHSFGGKVALAYAAKKVGELDHLLVLDSTPSVRPDGMQRVEAARVIEKLSSLPWPLPSREHFFELLSEKGLSKSIIEWLAMNVRRDGEVFRFRLDLDVVRALLADYFAEDLWPVLERPDGRRQTHVVLGGLSDTVSPADRARLSLLAEKDPTLHVHELPRAGHWVHVDDPSGLSSIVRRALAC